MRTRYKLREHRLYKLGSLSFNYKHETLFLQPKRKTILIPAMPWKQMQVGYHRCNMHVKPRADSSGPLTRIRIRAKENSLVVEEECVHPFLGPSIRVVRSLS